MTFFVDTADIADIRDLAATGMVDGITTNPLLVAKSGRNFLETINECSPRRRRASLRRISLIDKGLAQFNTDWEKTGQKFL